jgi:hypothetical protein
MYEYFMVQIPPTIHVEGRTNDAAARYLADVVGRHATQGWEFYSIETIGIVENMGCGCLAFVFTLFGWKTSDQREVYVIVFRRPGNRQTANPPNPPPVQFQS